MRERPPGSRYGSARVTYRNRYKNAFAQIEVQLHAAPQSHSQPIFVTETAYEASCWFSR